MADERSTGDVMREGMKLTLEWMELKKKKVNRTITEEEKERFLELDGYLLGLAGEAQARGIGVNVELPEPEDFEDGYDEDGYDIDGYDEDGYDENGEDYEGLTREDKERRDAPVVPAPVEEKPQGGGLFGIRKFW